MEVHVPFFFLFKKSADIFSVNVSLIAARLHFLIHILIFCKSYFIPLSSSVIPS